MSCRLNRTATYWPPPQFFWLQQHFFSVLWGPSLCWDMVLIPASSLQLIWTSCRRGYIIIWHPPTSCERHNSYSIQPFDSQGCPLISSTGCTCYLHRCISSFDSLAGVNMLQKNLSSLISTYSRRENSWIHTFSKGIHTMWKAKSLEQDLNSGQHANFIWL